MIKISSFSSNFTQIHINTHILDSRYKNSKRDCTVMITSLDLSNFYELKIIMLIQRFTSKSKSVLLVIFAIWGEISCSLSALIQRTNPLQSKGNFETQNENYSPMHQPPKNIQCVYRQKFIPIQKVDFSHHAKFSLLWFSTFLFFTSSDFFKLCRSHWTQLPMLFIFLTAQNNA